MLTKEKNKTVTSDLGLDKLGDLSDLLNETPVSSGGPLELPLSQVDEDPDQPRKEFDRTTLGELANSVAVRGVKTPVSVRTHPSDPERYILNHGARRYRASKMAGKDTIPAFIDEDYNQSDQIVENLQRDGLTAREIAEAIQRELNRGKMKKDVAKEIGKSAAYVTQYTVLLDLPGAVAEVFYSGRCNDVTVINEIVKLVKKNEGEVYEWLADSEQELTRGTVKLLKEFLAVKQAEAKQEEIQVAEGEQSELLEEDSQPAERDPHTVDAFSGNSDAETVSAPPAAEGEPEGENDLVSGADIEDEGEDSLQAQEEKAHKTIRNPVLHVIFQERVGQLVLDRMATEDGMALIRFDSGELVEADLGDVRLSALIEG